ncbi:asparaginase [Marinomonas sp. MED121]|uniref:asparaginase domain-containing protein n=1 Tax=Marinomonas sp. MED121 TaxID=314277 RepID=UPI000068FF7F|nr:asparaginase domain-containing protein [Marinomonas sp. MED121]EAQ66898.1 asparaginase [Marinomonas sp. MED121]
MTNPINFHLITTGGTIDSYYDPDQCGPLCFEQSVLPKYLEQHCALDKDAYQFSQVCMKDSREMTTSDREDMLAAIVNSQTKAIVLTHGSFTLFDLGRFLQKHKASYAGKTVILTGSLRPIDGFTYSDGLFNLGAACLAAQYAPAGIYICIQGRLYGPEERELWH